MLKIEVKNFSELKISELYQILRLRSEVFVVEQECIYQDIDNKDQNALHVIGYYKDDVVAYTRIFNKGFYFEEASIGRVVVEEKYRSHGYGYDIMKASVKAVESEFETSRIKISAQTYLRCFYNNLNFYEVGEEYLEDGIPHIAMLYTKENST